MIALTPRLFLGDHDTPDPVAAIRSGRTAVVSTLEGARTVMVALGVDDIDGRLAWAAGELAGPDTALPAEVLDAAVVAAASTFDWLSIHRNLTGTCKCGMTAEEVHPGSWADSGFTTGREVVYEPDTTPCPACQDAVRPLIVAALQQARRHARGLLAT